jgi:hypothetical protein
MMLLKEIRTGCQYTVTVSVTVTVSSHVDGTRLEHTAEFRGT